MKNFFTIFMMNNRQAWFHKRAVVVAVLAWAVRMGLTILLYKYVYNLRGGDPVKGITFQVAASGMILYALVVGFGFRGIFRVINDEFKSGAVEVWINKPINYLVLKSGEVLGQNVPVLFGLSLAAGIFWLTTGQFPGVDYLLLRILLGITMFILGVVIGVLIYSMVGLSVVWLNEAQPIFLIVDKLIMIFGGAFIPIGFLPATMRMVGETLPTGATVFATQVFYPNFIANSPRFLFLQLFWAITLFFVVRFMQARVNIKLTVNGG
jgi:ABC-type uncharacterized transport system permease subunit